MNTGKTMAATIIAAFIMLAGFQSVARGASDIGFFVTSVGSGDGANLGGLEGADARCQELAATAGVANRKWAAYLSTQGADAVDARDRIGDGPWRNVEGIVIAENIGALHRDDVNINHRTALDERGKIVPYVRVDAEGKPLPLEEQPSGIVHDILTGTQTDGTAFPVGEDKTCGNWTSNSAGSAVLGHHDRRSLRPGLSPWANAHPSKGCSQQDLVDTGGGGLFYCFATD